MSVAKKLQSRQNCRCNKFLAIAGTKNKKVELDWVHGQARWPGSESWACTKYPEKPRPRSRKSSGSFFTCLIRIHSVLMYQASTKFKEWVRLDRLVGKVWKARWRLRLVYCYPIRLQAQNIQARSSSKKEFFCSVQITLILIDAVTGRFLISAKKLNFCSFSQFVD